MRFIVQRTSEWGEKQPCPEAVQTEVPLYDIRTCSEATFDKNHAKSEGKWRSLGTNHTVLPNGYIRRQKGMSPAWAVEFMDLPALMAFVMKYGRCVVNHEDEEASIEIYDDYRE